MRCEKVRRRGEEEEEDGMHSKREPTHRRVVGKREYAIESAAGARGARVYLPVFGQKMKPLSHFRHVTLKTH